MIDERIKQTYAKDSKATLQERSCTTRTSSSSAGQWIGSQGRDGIVCLVTNNSFVDQIAFDGMRKHLLQDFTAVYHLDLEGNVRQNPKLSGNDVQRLRHPSRRRHHVADPSTQARGPRLYFQLRREDASIGGKRRSSTGLVARHDHSAVDWRQDLTPDSRYTWLVPEHADEFAALPADWTQGREAPQEAMTAEAIFKMYSLGVATNRDDVVYDFRSDAL